jgi:hypothetical protein
MDRTDGTKEATCIDKAFPGYRLLPKKTKKAEGGRKGPSQGYRSGCMKEVAPARWTRETKKP